MFIKKCFFVVALLTAGCGGATYNDGPEDATPTPPVTTSDSDLDYKFPWSGGLFIRPLESQGLTYQQLQLGNDDSITFTTHTIGLEIGGFGSADNSFVEGGLEYMIMTESGWEDRVSRARATYALNGFDHLIQDDLLLPKSILFTGEKNLTGLEIEQTLGEGFDWASERHFSQGAKQYFYESLFAKEYWIIEPESCGLNCETTLSLGSDSLQDWVEQHWLYAHSALGSGYDWLGMSLFFDSIGKVYVYSSAQPGKGLVSELGAWEIYEENGVEVLEIDVPAAVKQEFNIDVESSRIISKIDGVLTQGTRYLSSGNIEVEDRNSGYFLNYIANEDLKNALIIHNI